MNDDVIRLTRHTPATGEASLKKDDIVYEVIRIEIYIKYITFADDKREINVSLLQRDTSLVERWGRK